MKKSVFKNLKYLDDCGLDRLNRHVKSGGVRQDRIFKMSEEKLGGMRMEDDKEYRHSVNEAELEKVEVSTHAPWVTPLKVAATCIAAVLLGAGVMGALKVGEIEPSSDNSIYDMLPAKETKTQPHEDSSEFSQTVSAAESVLSKSEESVSSSASGSKVQSDVQSKAEMQSESQTHYPNIPAEIFEQEQNTESEISDNSDKIDTSDDGCNEPEAEINIITGFVEMEQLLKVTENMSYRDVVDLLGMSNTPLYEGNYAEYIVDGEYLLMLKWDYDTDPVLRNGKTLLESCPHISNMLNDPNSFTFDCYVVDFTGTGITVTCPQYDFFSCARISVDNTEMRSLCDRAITDNAKLRVKYSGDVLETYPPIITAESMEIVP